MIESLDIKDNLNHTNQTQGITLNVKYPLTFNTYYN